MHIRQIQTERKDLTKTANNHVKGNLTTHITKTAQHQQKQKRNKVELGITTKPYKAYGNKPVNEHMKGNFYIST